MPVKQQTITIQNLDTDSALAVAYETFTDLGWQPQFAGPDKLLGKTPQKATAYGRQIIVEADGNNLNISSATTAGETFDLTGKNNKNIKAFINAFQLLEKTISTEKIAGNKQALNALREETIRVAEEDARQNAEVDAVMNLSKSNLYVTYSIISINVLVFVVMTVSGVPLFSPTVSDIIKWGGNFAPLTVGGDWWRLLTNVFVHIGLIHIAFNMYALYMVGIYLEPMLGKLRYAVAYLCTGIIASLVSLWWHSSNPTASAGASGAIFGMYGVFLALLSTSLIPKKVRAALLQSIGIFVVYNLVYGLKSGVDNAAHIGGILSGVVIGYIYYFTITRKFSVKNIAAVCVAVAIVTITGSYLLIKNSPQESNTELTKLRNEVRAMDFKDMRKYQEDLERFSELEKAALPPEIDNAALNDIITVNHLKTTSLPKWQEAATVVEQMKTYDLPENLKQKILLLEKYTNHRIEEVNLQLQVMNDDFGARQKLYILQDSLRQTIDSIKAL